MQPLREAITNTFYKGTSVQADEVFVSDGSKCDISRMQAMFGSGIKVAVQDPAYPVSDPVTETQPSRALSVLTSLAVRKSSHSSARQIQATTAVPTSAWNDVIKQPGTRNPKIDKLSMDYLVLLRLLKDLAMGLCTILKACNSLLLNQPTPLPSTPPPPTDGYRRRTWTPR